MDIAGLLESNMNKLQKAEQRLSLAKSMVYPSTYSDNMRFVPEIAEGISEHLSRIPYSQEVHRKKTMKKMGGNRRKNRRKDRRKRYQFF